MKRNHFFWIHIMSTSSYSSSSVCLLLGWNCSRSHSNDCVSLIP